MNDITYSMAFIAGLASFVSPCFLPLIPVYLIYLSGKVEKNKKLTVIINSLFFILGFTIVFVSLGAAASSLGHFLLIYKSQINKVLGIVIVLMGIFYLGIFNIPFLNMEKRLKIEVGNSGFLSSFLLGIAISFGWTPCIGPILSGVLSIAASKNSVLYGVKLLFAYSMGIAVPFVIFACLIQSINKIIKSTLKYTKVMKIINGILLIGTGILLYIGYF